MALIFSLSNLQASLAYVVAAQLCFECQVVINIGFLFNTLATLFCYFFDSVNKSRTAQVGASLKKAKRFEDAKKPCCESFYQIYSDKSYPNVFTLTRNIKNPILETHLDFSVKFL